MIIFCDALVRVLSQQTCPSVNKDTFSFSEAADSNAVLKDTLDVICSTCEGYLEPRLPRFTLQ